MFAGIWASDYSIPLHPIHKLDHHDIEIRTATKIDIRALGVILGKQ